MSPHNYLLCPRHQVGGKLLTNKLTNLYSKVTSNEQTWLTTFNIQYSNPMLLVSVKQYKYI